jgi:hypothetical protein
MKRVLLVVAALLSGACTFEDGTGFGTLRGAELSVELVPGEARDLGDRTVLTDQGYALRLETAVITLEAVELKELQGGGGQAVSFDPANPPPGYSLCHAGHCHAADGSLPTYEEIEDQLAGGSASFVAVVSLPVNDPIDLWSGDRARLGEPAPSAELPQTNIRRVSVSAKQIELRGEASLGPVGGGIGPTPVPLEIVLPIGAAFDKSFELDISRDEPGEFSLSVDVVLTARVIDGIDYATLVSGGSLTLNDPEAPAALTLIESLLESELEISVK